MVRSIATSVIQLEVTRRVRQGLECAFSPSVELAFGEGEAEGTWPVEVRYGVVSIVLGFVECQFRSWAWLPTSSNMAFVHRQVAALSRRCRLALRPGPARLVVIGQSQGLDERCEFS